MSYATRDAVAEYDQTKDMIAQAALEARLFHIDKFIETFVMEEEQRERALTAEGDRLAGQSRLQALFPWERTCRASISRFGDSWPGGVRGSGQPGQQSREPVTNLATGPARDRAHQRTAIGHPRSEGHATGAPRLDCCDAPLDHRCFRFFVTPPETDPVAFTALSVVGLGSLKPSESVGAGARPVKGRSPGWPIRSGRPPPPLRSPESQHR
jgi:hypothetical protein